MKVHVDRLSQERLEYEQAIRDLIDAFDHVAHCVTCGYEAVSRCREGTECEEKVRAIETKFLQS